MEELKMIIAGNIGQLRRKAELTQLELAEQLNYSDKAVSKWERGESIPDIVTLKAIADRFNVTVDYLMRAEHPVEAEIKQAYTKRQRRNHRLITLMACVLVWLITCFVYTSLDTVLPMERQRVWMMFIYAVPLTIVVLLVFNSIWGKRHLNFTIISFLIWSVLSCCYLTALVFFHYNFWIVFIIGIPAQVIVGLWSGLRYK